MMIALVMMEISLISMSIFEEDPGSVACPGFIPPTMSKGDQIITIFGHDSIMKQFELEM